MNIFLTGGSGFVGRHLIPYLIKHDHQVFALCRSYDTAYKVRQLGAQPVLGDLNGIQTLGDTLQNMDAVIHSAAYMDLTYHKSKYYTINVSGTQLLVDAAKKAGIRNFIYISAASVVNGECVDNIDETCQPKMPGDYFSRTKLMAEKIVLAANSANFRVVALRPPFVWGMENPHLVRMLTGKNAIPWKWIGPGTHHLSTIHIQNLIAAIGAALDSDKGGEVYFVTDGETRPFKAFFTILLNAEGIIIEEKQISRGLAMLTAKRVEWYYKKFRRKMRPPISPAMIYLLGTQFTLNDEKARTELHYENVISLQQGLDELKEKIEKMQQTESAAKAGEEKDAAPENESSESAENASESVDIKEPDNAIVIDEQSEVEQKPDADSSEPDTEKSEKELDAEEPEAEQSIKESDAEEPEPMSETQEISDDWDGLAPIEVGKVETKDAATDEDMLQEKLENDEVVVTETEPAIENVQEEPQTTEAANEPEQNEAEEPEKQLVVEADEADDSTNESIIKDAALEEPEKQPSAKDEALENESFSGDVEVEKETDKEKF